MAKQTINVGTTANDNTGDTLRVSFTKVNANFTELYTNVATVVSDISTLSDVAFSGSYTDLLNTPTVVGASDRLVNGSKEIVLGANGTLTVPSPTSNQFATVFSAANYVPTLSKPTLTLTGTPWALNGQYVYAQNGETQLALDNMWPTLNNPGYTSGDTFTFDSTVHGIADFVLTIQLNDVVQAGPAGWTANVAASQPPVYASTIKSLGAVKLTSSNSSWIFSTDGKLKLPVDGDIVDSTGTSVLSGGANTDVYKFQFGTIGTKDNPDTGGWGGYNIVLDPGGESYAGLFIPSVASQDAGNSLNIYNNRVIGNSIALSVNSGSFVFKGTGTLELPVPNNLDFNNPSIKFGGATSVSTNNYGFGVPGLVAGVVYNATTLNLASMKLLITIEGQEDGGDGFNHTQVCEMLVVRRVGATSSTVDSVVYGVIHTSLSPLATLTTQQSVDGRVEILAQPTNTTPIYVKVHATEVRRGD